MIILPVTRRRQEYESQEDPEILDWWALTPAERFRESAKLWTTFLALGGSLEPEPDSQSPSILRKHRVRALLMGGQACILYGAAEFSRDIDLAVLADQKNLSRLQAALSELKAEPVFVPPLSTNVLLRGHACHFRCAVPGTDGLRIDVMSVLHGCKSLAGVHERHFSMLPHALCCLPFVVPSLSLRKRLGSIL